LRISSVQSDAASGWAGSAIFPLSEVTTTWVAGLYEPVLGLNQRTVYAPRCIPLTAPA
jgi:hypothetical protein